MTKKITDLPLSEINTMSQGNMAGHIGIEITAIGEDFIEAKMPVDSRTKQPLGLLHGGASAAFAETLGSVGSYLLMDKEKERMVGLNLTCSHLKSAKSGFVFGKAVIVHKGRSTHLWQVEITNEDGQTVNLSTLTVAIIPLEKY